MGVKNGYFQLDNRADGIYVIIFPPEDGGQNVDVMELTAFLDKKGIGPYDIKELNMVIQTAVKNQAFAKVSDQKGLEFGESMELRFSEDHMTATARFYPPTTKGQVMDMKEIVGDLQYNHIQYGINAEILQGFVQNRTYCTDIVVARGTQPVQGKDAYITYNFDVNPTGKPKQLEDGSVDFHSLNIFTKVEKGALLATLTPAVQGKPGKDVYGNEIAPAKVKNLSLKYSRNISVSEDKLQMFSDVSGDVQLVGDTVFVSDTYTVMADVDPSTGDIEYDGNVIVTGNVRTGFTIRAKGSVQVNGVVEGAYIYSGDSIVLNRGMQGMSKGYLEAENNIVAKFVESGTLTAKNNITVGSLLHSKVKAGNDIVVNGKKAFIIGGDVSAGHMIDVRSTGNQMETLTVLRVGIFQEQLDKLNELRTTNESIKEDIEKYTGVVNMFRTQLAKGAKFLPEQIKKLQSVAENLKQLEKQFNDNDVEIKEIEEAVEQSQGCKIKVSDVVNVGTEVHLNGHYQAVRQSVKRCIFRLAGGEIEHVGY
ncbi:MAG: FapA family protein [Lachnospiraceae bacterium]|nr:FapA family protein [Lachnospiraceae bacterium]